MVSTRIAAGSGILSHAPGLDSVDTLAVGVAKSLVLNALTFGGYGTYELGAAMWKGYTECGVVGALNAVNPLYAIARGGADTYLAVEDGDYRKAAAHGTVTVILGVATAFGIAEGVGALAGGSAVAGGGAAARGGGTVLLDSNVVAQLGKDATLAGRLAVGERGVVSYVTGPELRNAVARGSLRGVPRALEGLPVLGQRPSLDGIINFRGGLVRQTGRFGDGIIGAQSVEFGIPLITNDAELAAAVRAAGGVVR